MDEIRVRFAPSPTGALHIGGARTALFNYLFAKSQNGKLILRLEDTDTARSQVQAADGILDGLQWLGLDWDEGPDIGGPYGPYQQSLRLPFYEKTVAELIDKGHAYYCFCSNEKLQQDKESAQRSKLNYKYDGTCKDLTPEEQQQRFAAGLKPVIRLIVPETGNVVVQDIIRGAVEFKNELLDDFIIMKSDGRPTYNLAVVADDHHMKISHVIRAEEHLSNTPKQIHVYQALGWEVPQFAHVSMILAPDRSKLSKRHGATSVQEFREQGYLSPAMLNYLVLLGWSSGEDVDVLSPEAMLEKFKLEQCTRSPAIYDIEKLTWMNSHYLNTLTNQQLCTLLSDEAEQRGWLENGPDYFAEVVALVRSRSKTLQQIIASMDYFWSDTVSYDPQGIKKYFVQESAWAYLNEVKSVIIAAQPFQAAELEVLLRQRADHLKIKAAALIHPARLAVSGQTVTPGIFEVMELLGPERCMARLDQAMTFINNLKPE